MFVDKGGNSIDFHLMRMFSIIIFLSIRFFFIAVVEISSYIAFPKVTDDVYTFICD